jgi:hypothetical protein
MQFSRDQYFSGSYQKCQVILFELWYSHISKGANRFTRVCTPVKLQRNSDFLRQAFT